MREQIQGVKRKKNAFRSSVAPWTSLVTTLRYVPREYRSGNSKTRESRSYRPVVDREARSEIPKNAMCAIFKVAFFDRGDGIFFEAPKSRNRLRGNMCVVPLAA